jgi:hypothetical protein
MISMNHRIPAIKGAFDHLSCSVALRDHGDTQRVPITLNKDIRESCASVLIHSAVNSEPSNEIVAKTRSEFPLSGFTFGSKFSKDLACDNFFEIAR